MSVAVYDNPATMAREAWQDGKRLCHVTAAQLMTKDFRGHPRMFFGLNVGQWETGRVIGDRDAISAGGKS